MTQKENLLRAIRHQDPAWVPNGMESVVTIGSPVVERPGQSGKDAFGVDWSMEKGAEGGTYPTHNGHPITDLSRWREQITMPNLDEVDWSAVRAQAKAVDRDRCLVSGFVEMGLFERSYLLLGMEAALVAYVTETSAMAELSDAIADYKIRLIEHFDDAIDMDMIWYGDDWGTQDSLFMPPAVWRKAIKPGTQRIYDCLKERNIIINQHSCGKIEQIFDDMIEMGADIWNPCQPCNNLASLKKRSVSRIAFCGGIDSQFILDRPGVTVVEVRAEVCRRIDELATGGGYIAAPSHGVPYQQELIDAMNDEITIYGRAFYRKKNESTPNKREAGDA
jgi:uroporphyrinogen-III decarboxylase